MHTNSLTTYTQASLQHLVFTQCTSNEERELLHYKLFLCHHCCVQCFATCQNGGRRADRRAGADREADLDWMSMCSHLHQWLHMKLREKGRGREEGREGGKERGRERHKVQYIQSSYSSNWPMVSLIFSSAILRLSSSLVALLGSISMPRGRFKRSW